MPGSRQQIRDIAAERLGNQHLTRPFKGSAAELVQRLGGVQAQEYPFAKWALARRLAGKRPDSDIESACDEGLILRTHVLRPTWHFVAAEDIGWMLELTGPRVMRALATYLRREGLDSRLLTRAVGIFERSLAGGRHLTRQEVASVLAQKGIPLTPSQLSFVMMYAELERIVCSGPRRGRHATYALVSERVTSPRQLTGDEALAELTRRFFASHGPATIRDFVWWSGLRIADTKRGLDIIGATSFMADGLTYWSSGPRRRPMSRKATVYLLPIYDEYFVAYRDRLAVPHGPATIARSGENVTFWHALVIDGQAAGTWRLERGAAFSRVTVTTLRRLSRIERTGLDGEAARLARFLGAGVTLAVR